MILSFVRSSLPFAVQRFSLAPSRRLTELAQRRILLKKMDWAPETEEDPDHLDNLEHLGDFIELNRDIQRNHVVSRYHCYRNLHLRGLLMRISNGIGKDKAVSLNYQDPLLPSEVFSYGVESTKNIDKERVRIFLREVRRELSSTKYLYVHDGAVGSHPSIEIPVRFLTNDAEKALFFNKFLPRVPLREPADFQPTIVGYFTSTLDYVPNLETKPRFLVLDYEKSQLVSAGLLSLNVLQDSLANFTSTLFQARGVLLLRASALQTQSSAPVLIIGAPDSFLAKYRSNIFAANHTLWNKEGIYRVWDGISFESQATNSPGDLIENQIVGDKKATRVYQRLEAEKNIAPQPQTIVFFNAKGKNQEVDAKTALRLFEESEQKGAKSQLFEELLKSSNAKVFSVELGATAAQIKKLLNIA